MSPYERATAERERYAFARGDAAMSAERQFFCADYSCVVTELPCPHCGADEHKVVDL